MLPERSRLVRLSSPTSPVTLVMAFYERLMVTRLVRWLRFSIFEIWFCWRKIILSLV